MDESGQPNGAVPTTSNGTGEGGDNSRLGGWAPPPVMAPTLTRNGSDVNGMSREHTWSSTGAVLDQVGDPLSDAWPGAAGYGQNGYHDVGTPVAFGAAQAVAASGPATVPAQVPGAPPTESRVVPAAEPPPVMPIAEPRPVMSPVEPRPVMPVGEPRPVMSPQPVAPPVQSGPPPVQSGPPPVQSGPPPVQSGPPRGRAAAGAYPASAPPYQYEGDLDSVPVAHYESWNPRPVAPPSGHAAYGESTQSRSFLAVPPTDRQPMAEPVDNPPDAQHSHAREPDRAEVLPQRVPAKPDVPALADPVADEVGSHAEAAELARIAARLKYDAPAPPTREGFDVDAVLAAVRAVPGVRDAKLRRNRDGSGVHTLRLDLADGADPGQVSRLVARLLGEKMGLSAALGTPATTPRAAEPPVRAAEPRSAEPAPYVSTVPPVPPPATHRATAKVLPAATPPDTAYQARRRHPTTGTRGRAVVEPRRPADDAPPVAGQRPLTLADQPNRPLPPRADSARVVLDHVQVSMFGLDANVEVRLSVGERRSIGEANGPAVDGYILRLCAMSAAGAVDQLLVDQSTGVSRGRCYVEHAAVVPFGSCEVAVAVVLLVCNGWVDQLTGSAVVVGDPRQAVVRATLAAVNRRLESLLP